MARKAKQTTPSPEPAIVEKKQTVYEVNGEIYETRDGAENAVLKAKIREVIDRADDLVYGQDEQDEFAGWIAEHFEELLALRSN